MKNTFNMNVATQGSVARLGEVCPVLNLRKFTVCALFFLLSSLQLLQAQSAGITWVDRDSFKIGYLVDTESSTLNANSSYSVKLYLEMVDEQTCIGGHFDLTWPSSVSLDTANSTYSVPGTSWLGESHQIIGGQSDGATAYEATFDLSREDAIAQTGSGWVMTAHFVVGPNNISTSEAIVYMDGGITPIENIDLKQAAPQQPSLPATSTTVFPNPFSESIQVESASGNPVQVRLIGSTGTTLARRELLPGTQWDLSHLPAGAYFLEIHEEGHAPQVQRILKR